DGWIAAILEFDRQSPERAAPIHPIHLKGAAPFWLEFPGDTGADHLREDVFYIGIVMERNAGDAELDADVAAGIAAGADFRLGGVRKTNLAGTPGLEAAARLQVPTKAGGLEIEQGFCTRERGLRLKDVRRLQFVLIIQEADAGAERPFFIGR